MITTNGSEPLAYQIPHRCAEATATHLNPDLRREIESAALDDRGLLLQGPTGTGKTYAMAAGRRASYAVKHEQTPFFVDWPEFVSDVARFRSEFRSLEDRSKFDPERRLFTYRGPLFVDDVGQEQLVASGYKQGEAEALFDQFVNRRTGLPFALWMTTNLTIAELRKRYGERAASRLTQHCRLVELCGQDRRLSA